MREKILNYIERKAKVDIAELALRVGTDEQTVYNCFKELLQNSEEYTRMSTASNPYGDGFASRRIADILLSK